MVVIEERAHFSSWRVFLLVCNLPSILALLGLFFMPESPRFLLEAGREIEAMRVYQVRFETKTERKREERT